MKISTLIAIFALVGCVLAHPHQCNLQNGKNFYDLSAFDEVDFSFADDNKDGTTTYFNLCGPVAAIPECTDKNIAVCVQTAGGFVSKGYETMKTLNDDGQGKLLLSFSGDICDGTTQYVTDFELVCSQTQDLIEVQGMNNVDTCHRVVTLASPAFCPTEQHKKSKFLGCFLIITGAAACCCALCCCCCRRRFRRSGGCCKRNQQANGATEKKCFFQRFCKRSCDNNGYQPVSTQTEVNAVPMENFSSENVAPVLMYPPMYPMFNGQMPFVPMDAKTFQEKSDEALARQIQEQINNETA